jgi:hypothetical protein
VLTSWIEETHDQARAPESEEIVKNQGYTKPKAPKPGGKNQLKKYTTINIERPALPNPLKPPSLHTPLDWRSSLSTTEGTTLTPCLSHEH